MHDSLQIRNFKERGNMRALTCILLIVGIALSQGQGPKGPPPSGPPSGPTVNPTLDANTTAGAQHQVQGHNGAHAGPGSPAGPGGPASPNDPSNPWHELLNKMMDLMTAAASGGPLPGDQPAAQVGQGGNIQQAGTTAVQGGQGQSPSMPVTGGMQQTTSGKGQPSTYPQTLPTQPKTQPPVPATPKPEPVRHVVADCFWEGNFYRPGSDIVRGQHDRWCYVTYCDSNGKIQFWDDYNCPLNSMKPTSTHSSGSGRAEAAVSGGLTKGCNHKGMYYEPGQEIEQHTVGQRCYGTYCSAESQVVQWEDWCTTGTTIAPTPAPRTTRGGGGGNRKGPGKGGRKQGGRQGGGGGQGAGKSQRGQGQGQGQRQGQVQGQGQRQVAAEGQRQGGGGGQRQGGGGGQRQGGGGGRRQGGGGGQRQGGGRKHGSLKGCYHNQLYYQPNEDVVVGNIGDMCYGYYCEGNNVFVHWEDQCTPTTQTVVPTTVATPMGGHVGGFFFK